MASQERWKATASAENSKLVPKGTDWVLPGTCEVATRVRHGGSGRPNLDRGEETPTHLSDSELSYDPASDGEESIETLPLRKTKPPATRVTVETKGLLQTLEHFCGCEKCGSIVHIKLNTN